MGQGAARCELDEEIEGGRDDGEAGGCLPEEFSVRLDEGAGRGLDRHRAGADDADYRAVLAGIRDAKKKLDEIKRFDMPGFRPRSAYLREMMRYGIVSASLDPGAPIDVYATDRAYWKSLWYTRVRDE